MEALPEIAPTAGALGEIGGRPFAASVVDQQAALRGHGCAAPGEAKITFGTGAFVLAVAGAGLPQAGGGPLPTVAWAPEGAPPTYALEGGVYAAAAAVNWVRGLGLFTDWAEIDAFDAPPAISRGLAFVPALAGLACPHWDRRARGAWFGMGLDTGKRDLVQAVLEGVAFRAAEVLGAIGAVRPLAGAVSIDGGMTRNPWFCQFLADTLQAEVIVSAEPETTALGTAVLAAEGAGLEIAARRDGRVIAPRPQPEAWAARFAEARRLVQAYGAHPQG
jgi:glycerol kinase